MSNGEEADVPRVVRMYGPVLKAVVELGGSARAQEVYERVASDRGLTQEARTETTASGARRFVTEIRWARDHLVRVGLLESSRRGVWALTERGHASVNLSLAKAQEIYRQVSAERGGKADVARCATRAAQIAESSRIADERSDGTSIDPHRTRVLELLQDLPSSGFEHFCRRLLREAGFQEVVVTGKAGDGGIDGEGILQVNALVSFRVVFQCKRYLRSVAPAEVRDFRGAMAGRATKGIFLTTGWFSAEARAEAVRAGATPIELVDGEKLVDLLEQLELGLVPARAFRVDEEFFASFREPSGDRRAAGSG